MTETERDPLDWRVPQEFVEASSFEVRDSLQDFVTRDLLGPWGGPQEALGGPVRGTPSNPRDRYLVGQLGPRKDDARGVDSGGFDSVDLDIGATVSQDADLSEQVNPRSLGKLWISSMGLTCTLDDKPDDPIRITVEVTAGRYARGPAVQTAEGRSYTVTVREPLAWTVDIDVTEGNQAFGLVPPHISIGEDGEPGDPVGAEIVQPPDRNDITLLCQARRRGDRLITRLTLINNQVDDRPQYAYFLFQPQLTVTARDGQAAVFGPSLHTGDDADPHADPEEARLGLLFRHAPAFVTGHNVAAGHDRRVDEPRAWRLRSEWLPVTDVPTVAPQDIPGLTTSMAALADLADPDLQADPGPLITALAPLVTGYAAWLDERTAEEAPDLRPAWRPVADRTLADAGAILTRLRTALDHLRDDPSARRAFAFANRAMVLQRHRSVAAGLRSSDPALGAAEALSLVTNGDGAVRHASWRPFQLGFVLLNLAALDTCDSPERVELVDLLFFPTGGGKTEAYLGLAAYAFAIRRLQGVVGTGEDARDGAAGVAVLMRYTLRLLTAQQFQRAAALVCATEMLRRSDPSTWGTERFSIGLWVGQGASPNTYDDAEASIAQARDSGRRGAKIPVLQTTRCPWCAEPLRAEQDLHPDDVSRRIRLYCSRGEDGPDGGPAGPACPFSRRMNVDGLPIMTVDEEVYREPPSLLIATVDKLAQLPWYGFAGMLFGRVSERCPRHGYRHPDLDRRTGCGSRHNATRSQPAVASAPVVRLRPPDLIIQDELHLISGALGSVVGLFETAVDELAGWVTPSGVRTSPKIIASTATTKRADEQVRALFARDLATFPPQVLDARYTYFSAEQPVSSGQPGRRYLGVCAHGTRLKAAEIRIAEILLLAGQTLLDTHGDAADPYATIVGYFNSTRELAGMRRYLDDDVLTRIRRDPWRDGMVNRPAQDLRITELTSRISSAYITDALRQIGVPFDPEQHTTPRIAAIAAAVKAGGPAAVADATSPRPTDVALATSMLQVGVDVGRLGLMVITGQPKNIAEYIQASSRVGRERDRPGLVITLFNWTRPRDLAYYEDFQHTHDTLYRRVEALSVTPFARRCLDRGTAATLIAALRNTSQPWSLDTAAQTLPLDSGTVAEVIERALDRAERAAGLRGRDYLADRIEALAEEWSTQQRWPGAPLGYSSVSRNGVSYQALMKPAGQGEWTLRTVARSMRETENEINLLLPASPQIFAQQLDPPAWKVAPVRQEAAPLTGAAEEDPA